MPSEISSKLAHSLDRFSKILSQEEIQDILEIQKKDLPPGIRINLLKASPKDAIKNLSRRYNWQVRKLPFIENGWTIQESDTSPGGTIEHRMGQYYLQDAASMVPVSLFEFDMPHPLILDMAASPGGKTTHLIDRSMDKGFIIANDGSSGRIPALRSVLETWGGINQIITNYPGEDLGRWFPAKLDIVLLDAPCSMENLRPTPNHPLRETSPVERQRLQERQIQLLKSGLQALKPGGQLVYSTCSLAPEEDEVVIDRILQRYPNSIKIENVSGKFDFDAAGLISFGEETFHSDLKHALRLWPHKTEMSGFFCALMTLKHPIETPQDSQPGRDFSSTHLKKIDHNLQDKIVAQINQNYGLDLTCVLEEHELEIYQRFDQLFLIPQRYLEHFIDLPYAYIGMPLGQWLGEELNPSHPFVSRFGDQFNRGKIQINESDVSLWTSGRDIRNPDTNLTPKGQYFLVTDSEGRNLGMGKLLPKRLRNMLPRGLI